MLLRRLLVTYISASVFWGLTGIACFGLTTGTIVGQVNDPISAAVAVQAENTDTGRIPKATTHTEDTHLIPGAYKIFVSPPRFKRHAPWACGAVRITIRFLIRVRPEGCRDVGNGWNLAVRVAASDSSNLLLAL